MAKREPAPTIRPNSITTPQDAADLAAFEWDSEIDADSKLLWRDRDHYLSVRTDVLARRIRSKPQLVVTEERTPDADRP